MSWPERKIGDLYSLASEMSAPVTLGGFVLLGHEVPNRITVGGAQALAMHRLPGGGRIIDAMGPDDGCIAWRAVFAGPDAAQRARILDVMRQRGAPVTLSFGDYAFMIIIAHYEYEYAARGAVINYSIRGEIVSQNDDLELAQSSLSVALQNDLSASIDVLQRNAAGALDYMTIVDPVGSNSLSSAADTLLSLMNTLSPSDSRRFLPSNGTLQRRLDVAGAGLQEAMLNGPPDTPGFTTISLTSCSANDIAFATGQAAVLAAIVQAGGYVNRARVNLAQATGSRITPLVHA